MRRRKDDPVASEWEARAKNILKGELKRRGLAYADLVVRLEQLGVQETERNLANKISRAGFSAAFFVQCLAAIGATRLDLGD